MPERDTKVIGYFAFSSPINVICVDVDACLVAGSEEAMESHMDQEFSGDSSRVSVKKTRFGEIVRGLMMGGAYAFDETSYARFYPLALEAGLAVDKADFKQAHTNGQKFFTVRLLVE